MQEVFAIPGDIGGRRDLPGVRNTAMSSIATAAASPREHQAITIQEAAILKSSERRPLRVRQEGQRRQCRHQAANVASHEGEHELFADEDS